MVVMNGKPSNQQTITGMLIHPDYKKDRISPDVGLLRIKGHLENTVKTAAEDALFRLAPGAPVFLYGFPGRLNRVDAPEATFVKGNIGRITTFDLGLGNTRENTLIQHSAFSSTGTSGSPIFNEAGQAIGINSGGYTENGEMLTGYNFGVRIDMIRVLTSNMGTP
jgi:S1-C subfamily serine protease